MSVAGVGVSRRAFYVLFAVAALVIAGVISYAASSAPDGLDSTTLRGCAEVTVDGVTQLQGTCIAQHTTEHAMASSPLADYAIGGAGHTGGIAGVTGVLITLVVAGGLFWLISRRTRPAGNPLDDAGR